VSSFFIFLTLIITALLCILNIAFAIVYRKRRTAELLSYIAAIVIEAVLFVFTLLLRLGILTHIPYHLPPHLPFNRAEIGTAIAIGVGLFPAAYWHRTTISQMRERMEKDAQVLKERDGGVHIRSNAPGEWMN
jgi:ABC-type dipeptide/oligopeptide/nickel transport system permease component